MFLLILALACNDNTDTDDSESNAGIAYVISHGLNIEGTVEQTTFTVFDEHDDVVASGETGKTLAVPTVSYEKDFLIKHGDPSDVGCDGQFLHKGEWMTLDTTETLADGDELDLGTPTGFPYYEWNGALQCTAWDDWGWEQTYDPGELTSDGETCVDRNGRLEIGADKLDFRSGVPAIEGEGTITDFEVTSDGLTLTWDINGEGNVTYYDCVVVD